MNTKRIARALAPALLATGALHGETLYEKDSITLEGSVRMVHRAAATCQVLAESESAETYERTKGNHGRPLHAWRVDFSALNGSRQQLSNLTAHFRIASEWPPFYVGESEAGERQGVRRAGAREALRRERSDRSKASLAPAGLPPPLLPPSRRGAARCPPRLPQALRRLRRSRLRPRHRLVPGSLLPRVPAPQAGAVLPLQLPHPLGRAGHPLLW